MFHSRADGGARQPHTVTHATRAAAVERRTRPRSLARSLSAQRSVPVGLRGSAGRHFYSGYNGSMTWEYNLGMCGDEHLPNVCACTATNNDLAYEARRGGGDGRTPCRLRISSGLVFLFVAAQRNGHVSFAPRGRDRRGRVRRRRRPQVRRGERVHRPAARAARGVSEGRRAGADRLKRDVGACGSSRRASFLSLGVKAQRRDTRRRTTDVAARKIRDGGARVVVMFFVWVYYAFFGK